MSSVTRAVEHPDKDEQGGKFQQVEGLATVDAEEIPCEFSVEDDFIIDQNKEGVNEEIVVKANAAGKKKELDAMEAFGIFDVCEELPRDAKVITTRWGIFRRATSGDADSEPESSDMMLQKWKDSTPRAAQQQREGWWTCMRFSTDIQSCASMQRTRTSIPRKTRMSTAGLRENGARGTRSEVDERRALVETEETDIWKTESCEEVQRVFRDGNRWCRNRAMSRAAITFQTTRKHIDLSVSPRRLLRVREQCGIGVAPRESGCKAQTEAC